MQAFQQLCGFNTLMYYSATLFAEIGFDQPTAVGLIISGTNFLFTLVALKWIDSIGRRRIMLISAPGMIVGLVLASVAFHCAFFLRFPSSFLKKKRSYDLRTTVMTIKTNNILVAGSNYSHAWSSIVLLSMIIFVASYATGLGNVPWQQGELFPLEVRGLGTSLSTATNWSANLLINSTYLSLMAKITPSGAFGFYAGMCLLGLIFVVFCFPELAGLSLEEVRGVFGKGGFWRTIKEGERMRKVKREMREREMVKGREGV